MKPRIDPGPLAEMRALGGNWYAYQNHDLGHPEAGRIAFLKYGEDCGCATPPPHYPDTPEIGLGWRYLPIGQVDLDAAEIRAATPKKGDPTCDESKSN